jgi:hypothetical protein
LEPHHIKLLTAAAESWDRSIEARETVEREGAYVLDRFKQVRAHPAVGVEQNSKILFARMLRELCLDVEAPGDIGRPPGLGRG